MLTPINSADAAAGPERWVAFPSEAAGLVCLDLLVDQLPASMARDHCVLYLLDAARERVAEVRFVP